MAGGTTEIDLDHARFEDTEHGAEEAHAYVDGEWDDIRGRAPGAVGRQAMPKPASSWRTSARSAPPRLEFGVDYRTKKRDINLSPTTSGRPRKKATRWCYELDTAASAALIEENRIDPYLMFSGSDGERSGLGSGPAL